MLKQTEILRLSCRNKTQPISETEKIPPGSAVICQEKTNWIDKALWKIWLVSLGKQAILT